MSIQRKVKVITSSEILKNEPKVENFPVRKWGIEVCLVGPNGEDIPANVFDKVTYRLHPTFKNPVRSFKSPPFRLEEKGWGEFDLYIVFHFADKGGEKTITHDLNFRQPRYEIIHNIDFPTNKSGLMKLLAESGLGPEKSANSSAKIATGNSGLVTDDTTTGTKRKQDHVNSGAANSNGSLNHSSTNSNDNSKIFKKKPKIEKASIDLEKLAEGLQKLQEEDLIGVVQMVSDNKTPEMYIKNDVDEGEFHMDLYTLPDFLLRSLWDYVKQRVTV